MNVISTGMSTSVLFLLCVGGGHSLRMENRVFHHRVKTSYLRCFRWEKWVNGSHSVVSNSLWLHRLFSPRNSLGQNTGVGSLFLLQGIFPTQGSNPGLPHCRRILYQLSHWRKPKNPAVGAQSLKHWTAREVCVWHFCKAPCLWSGLPWSLSW